MSFAYLYTKGGEKKNYFYKPCDSIYPFMFARGKRKRKKGNKNEMTLRYIDIEK